MTRNLGKITESISRTFGSLMVYGIPRAILLIFIILPLATVFYESFTWQGNITLEHYANFFGDPFIWRCISNSLLVAMATLLASVALGVPMAYILTRYDIPYRRLWRTLATLALITPPYVGALAFKFLFGRHGTINLLLMKYFGLRTPINFIYGSHGIVLITTLHLYPLVMRYVMASLSRLAPSMEEAAKNLGAKGFYLFRTVTLPLMMPGLAAGSLLVFIWAFADLGTPLIIGKYDLIAPQAFFGVTQTIIEEEVRLGIVASVVMVAFSAIILLALGKYVGLKQYAVLTAGAPQKALLKHVSGFKRYAALTFCIVVTAFSLLPHVGILIGAFGKIWSFTPLPTEYTLNNFKTILIDVPMFLKNSFLYCTLTMIFDIVLGSAIAYDLIRKQSPDRNIIDAMSMLSFALPGVAVAIGYIRAFRNPIPFTDFKLLSTWMIIVLSLSMRRLPYAVQASRAALQEIHVSLEESSMDLGASRFQTFLRITLPLMATNIIVGGILVFLNSITELSTSWLLSLPGRGWEPMSVGVMIYAQTGVFGQAAAMGTILLVIGTVCIVTMDKLGGRMA